uniref:Uncharacterized protein n=1 Tax=uncultured marine virus TaxID=186617 RepID=A0A0F7L969_9VIRU|nr:hypothetical protein [uncultured marine virus]
MRLHRHSFRSAPSQEACRRWPLNQRWCWDHSSPIRQREPQQTWRQRPCPDCC